MVGNRSGMDSHGLGWCLGQGLWLGREEEGIHLDDGDSLGRCLPPPEHPSLVQAKEEARRPLQEGGSWVKGEASADVVLSCENGVEAAG